MLNDILESLIGHDIAYRRETLCRTLSDDRKLTTQSELEHREDLSESGMEVWVEGRDNSLQDAQ